MTRTGNQVVNKKKKKYKVDYLRVALIISLVYFCATFVKQQLSINEYNVKISSVEQDILEAKAKTEELKQVKTKADDAEYIEYVARNEYGLVKPYEKIFIDVDK